MVQRRFFDWNSPALPQFARALQERFGKAQTGGWDAALLVVPSRFVARRLTELLLEFDEDGALGGPSGVPRVVTVGQFPEELYEAQKPFADELTQALVWAEVLQSAEEHELESLLPLHTDEIDWLGLGQLLSVQHRELAAEGYRFADVLEKGATLNDFHDAVRWGVLDELQQRHLRRLDELGMWDLQTARLVAVETHECQTDRQVVLLGTVDLNNIVKAMLRQIADRVVAFVYAPESLADRFDEFGCLKPDHWTDERIEIANQQLAYAADAQDQIRHVIRILSLHAGDRSADEIAIGMLDRELVRELRRELQQVGVPTRWGIGPQFAQTPLGRLLDVVAEFAETRAYTAFSALVRHPDVYDWLTEDLWAELAAPAATADEDRPSENEHEAQHPPVWRWLSVLDTFAADHIPAEIRSEHLASVEAIAEPERTIVARVISRVEQWLQPFLDGHRCPLAEWAGHLRGLLATVYRRPLNLHRRDHRIIAGCLSILRGELDAWTALPASLPFAVDGAGAVRLLRRRAAHQELPPDPEQHGIELQGWLDLPWDDAAVTIITSFNDEFVPESLNSHLFLPNRLRRAVGLPDNARRYARDAYFLQAILRSRSAVHLITAKTDTHQDPLTPSRLMLTGQAKEIADRLIQFYEGPPADGVLADSAVGQNVRPAASTSSFQVRQPVITAPPIIQSISVTAFRDYIQCPFRFYLKHVLGLRPVADIVQEMDPAAFGSVIHEVLREFGESHLKDSTDAAEIESFLEEALRRQVRELYGQRPPVAVELQVRRALDRLRNFARWQASRREAGWRIEHVEFNREDCHFPAGGDTSEGDTGQSILLKGRIDRIDIHEATGDWALLDYKTGDRAQGPEEAHRQAGEWVDLQLPLYRHLVQPILPHGTRIELAFVTLSKQESNDLLKPATWDDAELREADARAAEIVRRILRGEFWPPAAELPAHLDEFAAICGTQVLWE